MFIIIIIIIIMNTNIGSFKVYKMVVRAYIVFFGLF
jgi:hypothetical protein